MKPYMTASPACFMDLRSRRWKRGGDVRYEVLLRRKGAKERLEAGTANLVDGLSSLLGDG